MVPVSHLPRFTILYTEQDNSKFRECFAASENQLASILGELRNRSDVENIAIYARTHIEKRTVRFQPFSST